MATLSTIKDLLARLRLIGMHNEVTRMEVQKDLDKDGFEILKQLALAEADHRAAEAFRKRVSRASFKSGQACLEVIDYKVSRTLQKKTVQELAECNWVKEYRNILITGPTGAGKSFIAQALGKEACQRGYSVCYLRVPQLLLELTRQRVQGNVQRYYKRLQKFQVIILDDFGLNDICSTQVQDLVELSEDRFGQRSTIITSQVPINDWHAYLGGQRMADSFLDRIVNQAHKLDLQTKDSLRKTHSYLTEMTH